MAEKGKFSLFRKKEDEDLKEAEARVEELEEKLSQKAREEAREKTNAEIRERHEEMMESAKEAKEAKEVKEVKKHVVVSGDTLSGIAKKYYDAAGKYMKIYEANKDIIGDDPNLIQPGMELVIPEL